MTDSEPLWKVMHQAGASITKSTGPILSRRMYAAEIRAIADWLVPEEDAPTSGGDLAKMKHLISMQMRAQLLDEADRAEAGE